MKYTLLLTLNIAFAIFLLYTIFKDEAVYVQIHVDPTPETSKQKSTNKDCIIKGFDYMGAEAEDPQLIEYIRHDLLDPPSLYDYNLSKPDSVDFSQHGQSRYAADEIFHGKKSGFFVEAGALDGEYLSNTLYLERELRWRGLLIEPHPGKYRELRHKHRNAFTMNVALSTTTKASELSFVVREKYNELSHLGRKGIKVKGIPLYSILLALEVQVVDFLSLDVESVEVKILETIPWEKVKFRLMCIEVNHITEGLDYLKKYLAEKGYKFIGERGVDAWFKWPELQNQNLEKEKT